MRSRTAGILSMLFLAAILTTVVAVTEPAPEPAPSPSPHLGPDSRAAEPRSATEAAPPITGERILVSGVVVDDDGRPLSGAEVLTTDGEGVRASIGRTDGRGAFRLGVPEGTVGLWFRMPGRVPVGVSLDPAESGPLRVRLRRGAMLRGVVLTEAGRKPVAHARIRVRCWTVESVETLSDASGRFTLGAFPAGEDVDVSVSAGSRGWKHLSQIVPSENGLLEVLLPGTFAIEGRVRESATGAPIFGVTVTAWRMIGHGNIGRPSTHSRHPQGESVVTGENGGFRIEGGVRWASLSVESDEWFLPGREPMVCEGEGPVEVFVVRRSRISGIVLGLDGDGADGAEVRVGRLTTIADADGRFVLEGVALGSDGRQLIAEAPGPGVRRSAQIYLTYAPGTDVADLVVPLRSNGRPRVPVEGVVLTEDGNPVSGAEVYAMGEERRNGGTYVLSDKARSGVDGRFELLLDGDIRWSTRVSAPGFVTGRVEFVTESDAPLVLDPVRLVALVPRTGKVVDEAGAPVPSADLKTRDGRPRALTPVGRDGTFTVWTAPGDDWRVLVEAPGFSDATLLGTEHPDGEEIVISLRRSFAVRGRLLDLEGHPVAGVGIYGTGGSPVITDLSGRFRFDVDEPGPDHILIGHCGHTFPRWLNIEAGGEEVDIRAVRPVRVAGIVRYEDGSPAVGASVRVRAEDAKESQTVKTGEDGRFSLGGLAARRFTVRVARPRPDFYSSPLRNVPGDSEDLRIVLIRGKSIEGVVAYPDGRSAFPVLVVANYGGGDPESKSTVTVPDGTFRIRGLRPGSWTIEVREYIEVDSDDENGESEDVYWAAEAAAVSPGTKGLRLVLRRVSEDD